MKKSIFKMGLATTLIMSVSLPTFASSECEDIYKEKIRVDQIEYDKTNAQENNKGMAVLGGVGLVIAGAVTSSFAHGNEVTQGVGGGIALTGGILAVGNILFGGAPRGISQHPYIYQNVLKMYEMAKNSHLEENRVAFRQELSLYEYGNPAKSYLEKAKVVDYVTDLAMKKYIDGIELGTFCKKNGPISQYNAATEVKAEISYDLLISEAKE